MTGCFITLEGGEGTGKSTHIRILSQFLSDKGVSVVATREPGGTPGAEAVRALLVTGDVDRWDALSETFLLNAARRDHVERLIRPALRQNQWVLSDRYIDSTLVYQGITKGIDLDQLIKLHELSTGPLWPDLTLFLDVDPALGLARAGSRSGDETRFEAHDIAFHQKLRAGFLDLAARFSDRSVVIDASGLKEDVSAQVLEAVARRFKLS